MLYEGSGFYGHAAKTRNRLSIQAIEGGFQLKLYRLMRCGIDIDETGRLYFIYVFSG
jgi:hypothetical protein